MTRRAGAAEDQDVHRVGKPAGHRQQHADEHVSAEISAFHDAAQKQHTGEHDRNRGDEGNREALAENHQRNQRHDNHLQVTGNRSDTGAGEQHALRPQAHIQAEKHPAEQVQQHGAPWHRPVQATFDEREDEQRNQRESEPEQHRGCGVLTTHAHEHGAEAGRDRTDDRNQSRIHLLEERENIPRYRPPGSTQLLGLLRPDRTGDQRGRGCDDRDRLQQLGGIRRWLHRHTDRSRVNQLGPLRLPVPRLRPM